MRIELSQPGLSLVLRIHVVPHPPSFITLLHIKNGINFASHTAYCLWKVIRRAARTALTETIMSQIPGGDDLGHVRSNNSNQHRGIQFHTGTTWRFVVSSGNGSLSRDPESDSSIDFLSILGIAQKLDIDFLPIVWQPALDAAGDGATAEISQSLVNVGTSFAFKRYKKRWDPQSDADHSKFQHLYFEILILGQPEIRKHSNIIRLEGLCWDISPDRKEIWPVLVFEKTNLGDLTKWSASMEGRTASHDVRLNICADVANAVRHLHMHRTYFLQSKPDINLVMDLQTSFTGISSLTTFLFSRTRPTGLLQEWPILATLTLSRARVPIPFLCQNPVTGLLLSGTIGASSRRVPSRWMCTPLAFSPYGSCYTRNKNTRANPSPST